MHGHWFISLRQQEHAFKQRITFYPNNVVHLRL